MAAPSSYYTGAAPVPLEDLLVLSQEIGNDEATYRIKARSRVHYITISLVPKSFFDDDTLCQPHLLIPKLPPFLDTNWTKMQLCWDDNGNLESTLSYETLDQVQSPWHSLHIDILSLRRKAYHNGRVKIVEFEGRTAISKVAIFEFWMRKIEHETRVYESITTNQRPGEQPIAPRFLGHLTEQGRIVGFLMEKVEGRYASLGDLPRCEAALRRLHEMGWIHGDPNRFNFIIEQSTGEVRVIDFEHAEPYEERLAQFELESLKEELSEETGRGGSVMKVDGVESVVGAMPYPEHMTRVLGV